MAMTWVNNTVSDFLHMHPSPFTTGYTTRMERVFRSSILNVNYSNWYLLGTSICSQPLKNNLPQLLSFTSMFLQVYLLMLLWLDENSRTLKVGPTWNVFTLSTPTEPYFAHFLAAPQENQLLKHTDPVCKRWPHQSNHLTFKVVYPLKTVFMHFQVVIFK